MKYIKYECPACGAGKLIEESVREYTCPYCDTKTSLYNENERIYRHVDEAKVRKMEIDKQIELRKYELLQQEREEEKKKLKLKIKASIILTILGILMMVLGQLFGDLSGNSDSGWYTMQIFGLYPFLAIGIMWLMGDKKND